MPVRTAKKGRLRVLGVDPAVAGATGYGVVEVQGRAARLLRFGALRFHPKISFATRLREVHHFIAGLLQQYRPDAVAVESVFASLNARTALKLAEFRGVVLLAAAQAGVPAHSYSPREIKATVAGYGGASKQQTQQMVASLLGLAENPEPPDAADALAVALCHAHLCQARERIAFALRPSDIALSATPLPRSRSAAFRILPQR